MKSPFATSKQSKRVYNSALMGAYFGIFNVFFVFIPYLTSIAETTLLFWIYSFVGIFILLTLVSVPLFYRNEYNYNIAKLKYLLFLGIYTLVFYLGLAGSIYVKLDNSKIFSNTYIMILYAVLSVMSAWDILSSVNKGFSYIKRSYTRTFKKHIVYNLIIIFLSVALGILFLLPQIFST